MPAADLLISFFVASLLFAYMPGPALLYTAAQTIAHGKKGGLMAVFGLHIGGYVHVIAAAAGLAALFHMIPSLYIAFKLIGAAYLVWLGAKLLFASLKRSEDPHGEVQLGANKSGVRAFADSMLVEILNPKTALFFVAFLPQFVDPAASFPIWLQLLVLGVCVNILFSSADIVCVLLASKIVGRLKQSQNSQKIIKAAGGSILIGLGAKVAFSSD